MKNMSRFFATAHKSAKKVPEQEITHWAAREADMYTSKTGREKTPPKVPESQQVDFKSICHFESMDSFVCDPQHTESKLRAALAGSRIPNLVIDAFPTNNLEGTREQFYMKKEELFTAEKDESNGNFRGALQITSTSDGKHKVMFSISGVYFEPAQKIMETREQKDENIQQIPVFYPGAISMKRGWMWLPVILMQHLNPLNSTFSKKRRLSTALLLLKFADVQYVFWGAGVFVLLAALTFVLLASSFSLPKNLEEEGSGTIHVLPADFMHLQLDSSNNCSTSLGFIFPAGMVTLETDKIVNPKGLSLTALVREFRSELDVFEPPGDTKHSYARIMCSYADEPRVRQAIADIGRAKGKNPIVKTVSEAFDSPRD